MRGTGVTRDQIRNAAHGAVFVWCNDCCDYPKRLAEAVERIDVRVVPKSWLRNRHFMGQQFTEIILDHAAVLKDEEWREYFKAQAQVRTHAHC